MTAFSERKPEDFATPWFAVLERAILTGNKKREAEARKELKRLGVKVEIARGKQKQ